MIRNGTLAEDHRFPSARGGDLQVDLGGNEYLVEPIGHYLGEHHGRASIQGQKHLVCLACQSAIHDPRNEFIEVDLNPSMEWKAKVLIGQSPMDIIDAARAALSFYSYQQAQQIQMYQALLKLQEAKLLEEEQQFSLSKYELDLKMKGLEKKIQDLQGEIVQITSTHREEQVAHQETKRQLHRLQILYDGVKQRELELLRSKSLQNIPNQNRDPLKPINHASIHPHHSATHADTIASAHSRSNPTLLSQRQFSFRSS